MSRFLGILTSLILLSAFTWLLVCSSLPVARAGTGREYLIKFHTDRASAQEAVQFFALHQLIALNRIPRIDVWVVVSRDLEHPIDQSALAVEEAVAWIEPNGLVHASEVIPNDYWFNARQGNLRLIRLPEAWLYSTGDNHPIAFIDTGVDLDHPDLESKIWINLDEIPANGLDDDDNGYIDDVQGWNFVADNNQPQDDSGHGSHVAGIAAARTNNVDGIAGVAWEASIMPLKALNSNATGTWADVAAAIIYATDNGGQIINLSLGGSDYSATLEAAVDYACATGRLLIAAAGNSGLAPIDYPARFANVLAVAATDLSDVRWLQSSFGAEVDIAAPGVNIFSATKTGSYAELSGTSMAAAHVSGLAALIWSIRPAWSAAQVTNVLTTTAHDVAAPGWDQYTGWGRIDAYAALRQAAARRWFLTLVLRP